MEASPQCKKNKKIMFVTKPALLDAAQNITLTFPDGGGPIETVSHHIHLGVVVDCRIRWDHHVDYICRRSSSNMGIIRSHCSHLPVKCRRLFYTAYILPILLYSCTAWTNINSTLCEQLETHHRLLHVRIYRMKERHAQDCEYGVQKAIIDFKV